MKSDSSHSRPGFEACVQRSRKIALYQSTSALLQWDQEINMPEQAIDYRGEQLAALCGHAHRLATDPVWEEWLEQAHTEAMDSGNPALEAEVARWQYDFNRAKKCPAELVERSARLESKGHEKWKQARAENDFSRFSSVLEELVSLSREKAECWGYEQEPYDALLESYEQGLTTRKVCDLFGPLEIELAGICQQAFSSDTAPRLPPGPYPIEQQSAFNQKVIEALGFDANRGRADTSVHPFSSSMGPHDHRITTRYDEADFTSSFFGLLHECGHSLYEQGLPADRFGCPSGSSVSLGIHESQSRFWENQIGRSGAFWEFWFPVACEYFPGLKSLGKDGLVAYVNKAHPTFIRVEAPEIGYDLHVLLRFDVERRLFAGDLNVGEIPEFWNERFEQLLGLKVLDDACGCLQDIHWSMGGFGYFPTYTLGSLNAAQLATAIEAELGPLAPYLRQGQTDPILSFLRRNIHSHGRRFLPDDLMEEATGKRPHPEPFLDYLRTKARSEYQ